MAVWRVVGGILMALALSACVMPGAKPAASTTPNPITGAEIATTTLAAEPAAALAGAPAGKIIGKDPAPMASDLITPPPTGFVDASEDAIKAAEAAKAPVKPAAAKPTPETQPKTTPTEATADPEVPPVPQSPEEAKCLTSGGVWATAGKGSAKACVKSTRDAGKACFKQTQCEGLCLARSGTCAPVKPLFGCNDVFEADGRRVTLCLD